MTVTGAVFKDIADAIREKDGLSDLMKITDMAQRIRDIPAGEGMPDIVNYKFPNDGNTHLLVLVGSLLGGYIGMQYKINAEIDWGDDTNKTTLTGSSSYKYMYTYHTYSKAGIYHITIKSDGGIKIPSGNYHYNSVFRAATTNPDKISEVTPLLGIKFGSNVDWAATSYGLGGSKIMNFIDFSQLGPFSLPDSFLYSANSLYNIDFPNTLVSINGTQVFASTGTQYYDFSQLDHVPTLGYANSFTYSGNPTKFEIIVPDELYDSWVVATNWSYSGTVPHIVKKSQSRKYGGPGI